jgi:predicted DNA-binding transcriptional regulator AlpA
MPNDPDRQANLNFPIRRVWDCRQVGARLGCSWRHVLRLADQGAMPWGFKLGALRRWDAEEIERWISQGCPPSAKAVIE